MDNYCRASCWSLIALLIVAANVRAQSTYTSARKYLDQPAEWYRGEEAKPIADVVLSYQAVDGGWPKNTDTAGKPYAGKPEELKSTFDNSATTDELRLIARMATHTKDSRYVDAFNRGLDFILKAQYPTGGWPQYYPPGGKYPKYITYNDGCMIRLMFFIREVSRDDNLYAFVDPSKRKACADAWDRGIDCVLKTQVKVDGKLTSWCAQHDEVTFEPRPARDFEPLSLSACETIGILHALMAIEEPSLAIVESVDACVAWLEAVKVVGIKVEDRKQEGTPRGFERFVVKDEGAPPMWARFYEIGTNRPIFSDRDSVIKYDLSEIGVERRTGYKWLGTWPKNLLATEYPQWKAKVRT
ncbi:MAG: pectate lyase, partial [Tepidisphaeraceae bacterium]